MMFRRKRYRRVRVAPQITRRSELKRLSNDQSQYLQYFQEVFKQGSPYIASTRTFREVLYYTSDAVKTSPLFSVYYGPTLAAFVESNIKSMKKGAFSSHQYHNYEYPDLIWRSEPYLNRDSKSLIVDSILKHNKNFYPLAKKELAKIGSEFIEENDKRAPEIFSAFYRNIRPEDFDTLLSKAEGGVDNPDVQVVLKKTKLFEYLKYDETSIQNIKKRAKLVKTLAKTPTLIKRINFNFHMTVDDIKQIAPAMRFNFIKFAFRHEIDAINYGYYYGDGLERHIGCYKSRHNHNKLVMPKISAEEMQEILFSICLQKHEEYSKWIKRYRRYLYLVSATSREEALNYNDNTS